MRRFTRGFSATLTSLVLGPAIILAAAIKPVQAQVAPLFEPHLSDIVANLPTGAIVRLPPRIWLSGPGHLNPEELVVTVLASQHPQIVDISLATCDRGIFPCLIGNIVLESRFSPNAQRELQRHKANGEPFTLAANIRGYLLEGPKQRPAYQFSSISWQQDDMIYTLNMPANERQNLLIMALEMAKSAPLRIGLAPSIPASAVQPR
ncbi:MAG: hypothetical protein AAGF24_16375 [Cyanobacteria bacterium P01_H01_bin.121]